MPLTFPGRNARTRPSWICSCAYTHDNVLSLRLSRCCPFRAEPSQQSTLPAPVSRTARLPHLPIDDELYCLTRGEERTSKVSSSTACCRPKQRAESDFRFASYRYKRLFGTCPRGTFVASYLILIIIIQISITIFQGPTATSPELHQARRRSRKNVSVPSGRKAQRAGAGRNVV